MTDDPEGTNAQLLANALSRAEIAERPRIYIVGDDHGVCVGGRFDGWFMWKHPDGQWVTIRKLEQEEPRNATPFGK